MTKPSAFPKPGEVLLAPSILNADFANLGAALRQLERAKIRWLHLDVMDRHFVPNLTFGPPVVKCLREHSKKLFFDAHLMVSNPMSMIEDFAEAGAQLITVHEEACGAQLAAAIRHIKSLRLRAGVAIKPKTPFSRIERALHLVDLVLIMTVEPGFGGQALIPSCLNKLRAARKYRDQHNLGYLLEVDGGINNATAELAVAAGAEVLVAGSAVFAGGRVADNVAALQDSYAHCR